eukprot:1253113-Alexandrium_andersonii.AAC.1
MCIRDSSDTLRLPPAPEGEEPPVAASEAPLNPNTTRARRTTPAAARCNKNKKTINANSTFDDPTAPQRSAARRHRF